MGALDALVKTSEISLPRPEVLDQSGLVKAEAEKLFASYEKHFDIILQHCLVRNAYEYLSMLRYKIYRFPRRDPNHELHYWKDGIPYVALNSVLLLEDPYRAKEYFVHGAFHFLSLIDSLGFKHSTLVKEMYCEYGGYLLLLRMLEGNNDRAEIVDGVMKRSPPYYTRIYKIWERLDEKNPGIINEMNKKAYEADRLWCNEEFQKSLELRENISAEFIVKCKEIDVFESELNELEIKLERHEGRLTRALSGLRRRIYTGLV